MPLNLEIIRFSEFVRLGAQGRPDLAASREALLQLAAACRLRGVHRALLDLREVHPGPVPALTTDDLAALVSTFREAGFSRSHRLAVLYAEDPHHRTRQFAFLTTMHGWNVKASDNFEELLLWLSRGVQGDVRNEAGKQKIPVHVKTPNERTRQIEPRENKCVERKTSRPRSVHAHQLR